MEFESDDIDPFDLTRDDLGHLVLIDPLGRRHVGVEPIRMFPLSDPENWISLCDAEGSELVCLEDLSGLADGARLLLREELSRREFVPSIEQILQVSSDAPPADWDVITDHGPTRFTLDSEDDVRRLGISRLLIVDSIGMRYLIPDIRTLDDKTNGYLERYS